MIDPNTLVQPFTALLSSLGTGVLPAEGPAAAMRFTSAALEAVHGTGRSGLFGLEAAWQGQAAVDAVTKATAVQGATLELSDRSESIAAVVDAAAADVRAGVVEIEGILRSFVSIVLAAAPTLATPAAQAAVLAAAVEHLRRAVDVIDTVRTRLGEHTSALTVQTPAVPVTPAAVSVAPAVQQILRDVGSAVANAFGGSGGGASGGSDGFVATAGTLPGGGAPSGPMPDGEVGEWIAEALEILRGLGYDTSRIDPRDLAVIISHESGGNPHAINLWDSNAAAGTPSKGIMQTIDSTFAAYRAPGHDDIWNPVHNIVAATRYAIDRYGDVSNVPGIVGVSGGSGYVGY